MNESTFFWLILYLLHSIDDKLDHIITSGGQQLSPEDLAALTAISKQSAEVAAKAAGISTAPPQPNS